MKASKTGLLIQVGQSASQLCAEIHKFEKKLGLSSHLHDIVGAESHHLLVSDGVYQSDDYELIMEQIRSQIEEVDIPREMVFAVDIANSRGVIPSLLEDVTHSFPGMNFNALALNFNRYSGLSVYNAILNMESLLAFCDSVCLRSVADAQIFLEKEHIIDYDTASLLSVIAADLVTVVNTNNRNLPLANVLFPRDICSTRSKLFDVRSSLWKAIQVRSTAQKFSSIRSLANNLHSIHNVVQRYDSKHFQSSVFVASSSLVDIHCSKRERALLSATCTFPNTEVSTAMKWATPDVKWLAMGAKRVRDQSTGLMSADDASVMTASTSASSRASVASSRMTSRMQSSSSSAGSMSSKASALGPDSNNSDLVFSALSFISPYSLEELKLIASKGKMLLDADAYVCRLKWNGQIEKETMYQAIDWLTTYIEDQSIMFSEN